METNWPGEPRSIWDAADGTHRDLWVPSSDDLPAFHTPQDVLRNYALSTPWWARALLFLLLGTILAVVAWAGFSGMDWESYGWVKRAVVAGCGAVVVIGCLWWLYRFIAHEFRWHRERPEIAQLAAQKLTANTMGIWGLFVGIVRLKDRVSGVNDTPDDIVFLFDMRVPRDTLQRQRAAATAWIEKIAAAEPDTNMPSALSDVFDRRRSVHCADVFGEPMRGVWMVRKGSVLPFETLGLAMVDPQTAEEFSAEDVIFLRRTPKYLRRRSRIAKV
ncbi:hypothetical protein PSU4_50580 [Pseudonocardia sulfidoxydans NBRC 16205]|uniref:Uncharacterized protein n=1 Tax=Pseudonocardia sulfidoxydans NBRC 16205 TaxID=1223511 RepID=A0A511DQT4_9PSEU|nr:hypothetical protein [Pseudonocardia sulfidoxydans]GEL26104.1 hypothetical protein PSU4_50580 [Pseudonocardia sulfidoxydans NBRC 16205]